MTSSTSWLVSFTFALNRAWILEKSFPCCLVRSPMTLSMSSWDVTKTHDCPLHFVLRDSAIVWRFSISFTSSAMNWPTSSTKKLSRKPGSCLSIHAFTEVGEVLDRDGVGLLVLGDDAGVGLAVDLGERLVDVVTFEGGLLAALRPVDARVLLEGGLEGVVLAALVEVLLEAGDGPVVAEVATALVEDLDEDLEQGVRLVLGDQCRLLVDVEEQALGRDGGRLLQRSDRASRRRSCPGSCHSPRSRGKA